MKFLEWAGWAGVSGLLALAALAAALVVTFIELRAWWIAPRSADLAVSISGESGRGGDEMMLTFRFRVVGPHTLHEVAIRRVGGAAGTEKLGDTVNVLSAREGYVERTTVVPSAQRPYHFVASWQERTRFGARMNGVRFGWGARVGMQSWKNYRWPFWPRQVDGRWVDYDYSPSRGARGIYLPDEDRPETLGQRFQRFRGRY